MLRGGEIFIWNRKTGVRLLVYGSKPPLTYLPAQDRIHTLEEDPGRILTRIAWGPAANGFTIASGSHDGRVTIWAFPNHLTTENQDDREDQIRGFLVKARPPGSIPLGDELGHFT